jgi:hypothetical protein
MEQIKIETDLIQECFSVESLNIFREKYLSRQVILVGSIFGLTYNEQHYNIFFVGMDYENKEVLYDIELNNEKVEPTEELNQICKSICIDYYSDYVLPQFENVDAKTSK